MKKVKKTLKVISISIVCIFAVFCINEFSACFWFNENNYGVFEKIGACIIWIGGFVVLFYIWSLWSELSEYREREKNNYIFLFNKQSTGILGNRFVSGEKISSFIDKYGINYYFLYDWILGRGFQNQMMWYDIVQRYKEAQKRIAYCRPGTDEWNEAQQMLDAVNKDAEYFVHSEFDLESKLYNWEEDVL